VRADTRRQRRALCNALGLAASQCGCRKVNRSRSRRVSALLATGPIPTSLLIACPLPPTAGHASSGSQLLYFWAVKWVSFLPKP